MSEPQSRRRPTRGRWIAAAASCFGIGCAIIAVTGGPGIAYVIATLVFAAVVVLVTAVVR